MQWALWTVPGCKAIRTWCWRLAFFECQG